MRLLHVADIHLGSKLLGKLPSDKSSIRKIELRDTFSRMVEYAEKNAIENILLAGDVFDDDTPKSKDTSYFYGVIKSHPEITFYYLRGNHDKDNGNFEDYPNLKRFGGSWTSYELDSDTTLTGVEFTDENASSIYSTLNLDPSKRNIVMLHGQTGSISGKYMVNLVKLRGRNIDYLALGHIHQNEVGKIDTRGYWAYPGCLEGRGYDELGPKGFYLLDTALPLEKGGLQFIPFAKRTIRQFDVDVSSCTDVYSVINLIRQSCHWEADDLVRLNLVGELDNPDEELAPQIETAFSEKAFCVSAKNLTTTRIDINAYLEAKTLRGEFVRRVMASKNTDEDKKRIIVAGLRSLNGEEVH